MKSFNGFPRRRTTRTELARRARLLAAFDRSGLSAAAFARERQLTYTTFCSWRQQRTKAKTSPGFVQVELPTAAPTQLMIELGAQARIRIDSTDQIALAVRLLQSLNAPTAC